MQTSRYFMRDLNGRKIDSIMEFDVAARRNRPRSLLEIGVFCALLACYLGVLALNA